MTLKEGEKYDAGKAPLDLLSPLALEVTAHVLGYGAEKYEPYNWEKGIKYSRVFAALLRHLWYWWRGEASDPETKLPHLGHAMCCLMFLLHYEESTVYREFDDRPTYR